MAMHFVVMAMHFVFNVAIRIRNAKYESDQCAVQLFHACLDVRPSRYP
jgi:hypothetical protein